MQRELLVEVKRLRELFEAVHGKALTPGRRPVPEKKPASKPQPYDPFSRPAPRFRSPK